MALAGEIGDRRQCTLGTLAPPSRTAALQSVYGMQSEHGHYGGRGNCSRRPASVLASETAAAACRYPNATPMPLRIGVAASGASCQARQAERQDMHYTMCIHLCIAFVGLSGLVLVIVMLCPSCATEGGAANVADTPDG